MATIYVYNGVAHSREVLGLQRLGEEVGSVVGGLDELYRDALLLDKLADEEVATRDVLRLRVELGVVGDSDAWACGCTCPRQLGREGVSVAELLLVPAEV